jgi:hypothetical protein
MCLRIPLPLSATRYPYLKKKKKKIQSQRTMCGFEPTSPPRGLAVLGERGPRIWIKSALSLKMYNIYCIYYNYNVIVVAAKHQAQCCLYSRIDGATSTEIVNGQLARYKRQRGTCYESRLPYHMHAWVDGAQSGIVLAMNTTRILSSGHFSNAWAYWVFPTHHIHQKKLFLSWSINIKVIMLKENEVIFIIS